MFVNYVTLSREKLLLRLRKLICPPLLIAVLRVLSQIDLW